MNSKFKKVSGSGGQGSGNNPRARAARRTKKPQPRRGVLLLVVLSMLVLFMLVGTAFLMSSDQTRKSMKEVAKQNRVGTPDTKLLERALFQIVRDTNNQASAIRYHSLLRDLYGTDGFQGVVYKFVPGDSVDLAAGNYTTRFAGATNAVPLGPTNGQFVDIFFKRLGVSEDDPGTVALEGATNTIDARHVASLDRDPLGRLQPHPVSAVKGYYNGCLLTITSGPAAGQSARILDSQLLDTILDKTNPNIFAVQLFRFRVMTFPRQDGQPLQIGDPARSPELSDLAGQSFIVNGRAFGGTGAGYNPLAMTGLPRLSALQLFPTSPTDAVGAELALLPNASYFNPLSSPVAASMTPMDPFAKPAPLTTFGVLNDPIAASPVFRYGNFLGPGDTNEGYDAADFQNMFLALQTATPRAQGRVVHSGGVMYDSTDPLALSSSANFLRYDLEDVPLPSFHRPDLVNFWNHRLLRLLVDTNGPFALSPDIAVKAIVQPYLDDKFTPNGVSPEVAALISAIKRQSMLRPTREDHPHFDGGNLASVQPATSSLSNLVRNGNIAIPIWNVMGPWDVDNDNDGIRDSVWVDLGDSIQQTEDGRRYKPLYAFLCIDLDSRLNVNAHGLADDIVPPALDPTKANYFDLTRSAGAVGNLAHDPLNVTPASVYSTLQLPRGLGYGPAEISLRPVFPAPLNPSFQPTYGNRSEIAGPIDSYATVLDGRLTIDSREIYGRYGFDTNFNVNNRSQASTAGTNYHFDPITNAEPPGSPRRYTGEQATPSLMAMLKFFDYPWSMMQPSAFGTLPDLKGRYALGLNYAGQPVYESLNDINPSTAALPPANRLPFNLLANSPYELNLSSSQRRDNWSINPPDSATAFSSSVDRSFLGGQRGLNDDAPFSPSDLEKVLRGWDADAGTLPSRLWDVVNDFDPLKLIDFDPNRIQLVATTALNDNSTPAILAAAQSIASINRRLVTTDSYDLPVAGQTMPAYASEFGPDGMPGRRGQPNQVLNDDFQVITGVSRAKAKIVDLLYYRAWIEARKFVMRTQGLVETGPGNSVDAMNAAAYQAFLLQIKARTDLVFARLPSDLLAPEVLAGNRMDLNRPFGDGKDNNGDGVVDDPMEAGEPFLDLNGNGKRDDGKLAPEEPFLDINGDKNYQGPGDYLWSQLAPVAVGGNGTLGEPISFDYTNGHAEPVQLAIASSLGVLGGVRNLESQGRQLYARHLYCLMMLLVDDNYVAPWDENDPQIATFIEAERKKLTSASPAISAPEADLIVKRKLTCRMIAQWAINSVDMRDSDVIMTPFEYDENPWDGWGVWGDDWTKANSFATAAYLPLDGDPATDENHGWAIDWSKASPTKGGPKTLIQIGVNPAQPVGGSNPVMITHPLLQTRGVVWGAERPELLITETLAFHDRRTEDLPSQDSNGHGTLDKYNSDRLPGQSGTGNYRDPDLDQSLRPRGALSVEVYNPWSADGQKPAELYRYPGNILHLNPATGTPYIDPATGRVAEGVLLNRLSNFGVDANGNLTSAPSNGVIKRSPVWRMIVVEEWPDARNSDTIDDPLPTGDKDLPSGVKEPKAYTDLATKVKNWTPTDLAPNPPFRPSDPDFDPAFDANFLPKQKGTTNQFEVSYPYIEREFYFTTDKSPIIAESALKNADWDYSANKFKLRIPNRSIKVAFPPGSIPQPPPAQTQKFISLELETASPTNPAIAPILPGHYGVIGTAGAKYSATDQFYSTAIGRNDIGLNNNNTPDSMYYPTKTRRIEMRPNADPTISQLVVGANGGDPHDDLSTPSADPTTVEIGRDNELIYDKGKVRNILDSVGNKTDGTPDSLYYQPTVTIPVEGMNISEPAWGYARREYDAAQTENNLKTGSNSGASILNYKKSATDKFEGRYISSQNKPASYDKPLDVAPELVRTGTTANYRTIHLQRLSNPLLPWNPSPLLANGQTNPDWKPNLPINPYRTVDTASVNLTAFNGTSKGEGSYPDDPAKRNKLLQNRPWVGGSDQSNYYSNLLSGKQIWYFRSSERGAWARLNTVGANAAAFSMPPQRELWAQEPAMVKLKKSAQDIFDLKAQRQVTMQASEVPSDVKTDQAIVNNHVNMVMEHSLGFGNKSWGLLYDKQGAKLPGTPAGSTSSSAVPMAAGMPIASAIGAPAPNDFVWDKDNTNPAEIRERVDSTFPWLAWDNSPYISTQELLNVPATSQSQMLRMYSTVDPSLAVGNRPNPYGLASLGTELTAKSGTITNAIRWATMQAPFGSLMNLFAASAEVADVVRDLNTKAPVLDKNGNVQAYGAPNFNRILEYVEVPSRYVGTDTILNAETFNDVPTNLSAVEPFGLDIVNPNDPRYLFQSPFNKVSRQRDPGKVNLNTVTSRRTGPAQIWSEVFDGIMHRFHDGNPPTGQLSQFGPAWRDVALSRRGYAQFNADSTTPIEKASGLPDVFEAGLNPFFPTIFANPFRSTSAGDLVPLINMMQYGVDASMLRKHPYDRAVDPTEPDPTKKRRLPWGHSAAMFGDLRDAGLSTGESVSVRADGAIPNDNVIARDITPLFSEARNQPFADTNRNPYMMYEPMSRLRNLVTNRSGVYAIWITVGFFEVEKAPDWNDPNPTKQANIRDHFGGNIDLYNRAYPDGYMLGKELGSETGDVSRPRGFYIIDRTEAVGFKPGEDLNVEKTIRVRRRIE